MGAPLQGNQPSPFHHSRSTIGGVARDKLIEKQDKAKQLIKDEDSGKVDKAKGYLLKYGSKGVGVAVMPIFRLVDVVSNSILGGLKIGFGSAAYMINSATKLTVNKKVIDNPNWNFSAGVKHLRNAAICFVDVFASPVCVVLNPYLLTHVNGNASLLATKEKLDEMSDTLAALEAQLQEQNASFANKQGHVEILENFLTQAWEESRLNQEAAVITKGELNRQITGLRQELEQVNLQLVEIQQNAAADQDNLNQSINQLRQRADNLTTELNGKQQELNEAERMRHDRDDRIRDLENELREQKKTFDGVSNQLNSKREELNLLQLNHSNLQNQLSVIHSNFKNLNSNFELLQHNYSQTTRDLTQALDEITDTKNLKQTAEQNLASVNEQLQAVQQEKDQLALKTAALENSQQKSEIAIAQILHEKAQLQEQITVLTEKLEQKSRFVYGLPVAEEEFKPPAKDPDTKAEERIEDLYVQIEKLPEETQRLQAEINRLQNLINEQEAEIANLRPKEMAAIANNAPAAEAPPPPPGPPGPPPPLGAKFEKSAEQIAAEKAEAAKKRVEEELKMKVAQFEKIASLSEIVNERGSNIAAEKLAGYRTQKDDFLGFIKVMEKQLEKSPGNQGIQDLINDYANKITQIDAIIETGRVVKFKLDSDAKTKESQRQEELYDKLSQYKNRELEYALAQVYLKSCEVCKKTNDPEMTIDKLYNAEVIVKLNGFVQKFNNDGALQDYERNAFINNRQRYYTLFTEKRAYPGIALKVLSDREAGYRQVKNRAGIVENVPIREPEEYGAHVEKEPVKSMQQNLLGDLKKAMGGNNPARARRAPLQTESKAEEKVQTDFTGLLRKTTGPVVRQNANLFDHTRTVATTKNTLTHIQTKREALYADLDSNPASHAEIAKLEEAYVSLQEYLNEQDILSGFEEKSRGYYVDIASNILTEKSEQAIQAFRKDLNHADFRTKRDAEMNLDLYEKKLELIRAVVSDPTNEFYDVGSEQRANRLKVAELNKEYRNI